MTRDELLTIAHECGFVVNFKTGAIGVQAGFLPVDCTQALERFAARVEASEREECAMVAESGFSFPNDGTLIAYEIRTRGDRPIAPNQVMDALEADYRARGAA